VAFGTRSGAWCVCRNHPRFRLGVAVLFFYQWLSRERKPQVMLAAGPSNPHSVRLALCRGGGLPLPRGLEVVIRIFGHLCAAVDASRARLAWVLATVAVVRAMPASLPLENGA
jgi:hypothetical protein